MKSIIFFVCSLGLWITAVTAQSVPEYTGFVNDYAGLLDNSQRSALEKKLTEFKKSTSNEIAVCIESSLNGNDEQQRSLHIAEVWGIGHKDRSNGILIYISANDRALFIQVGKGLEGAVPDIIANRISDNIMIPEFREGRYYEGISKGIDALMEASRGEYEGIPENPEGGPAWPIIMAIVIFVLLIIIFSRKGGGKGGYRGPRTYSGGGFFGGGFSGGGGGGGFGGFGGGSFGGGGAGGRW